MYFVYKSTCTSMLDKSMYCIAGNFGGGGGGGGGYFRGPISGTKFKTHKISTCVLYKCEVFES